MTKTFSKLVISSLTAFLAGCASQYGSGIALCDPNFSQLGPDTYYARGNCSGANHSLSAASSFCSQKGKASLVNSITGDDIVFRCLNTNDPEYRRPDYQKSPSVIIQDNRSK